MRCVFCGGKLETRCVNFTYEQSGRYLVVENVPAEVCAQCGEKVYSPEVTESLLCFARQEFEPVKVITVPVFDFAQCARA